MSVTLELTVEGVDWPELHGLAQRTLDAALSHLGYDPAGFEVSMLACGDARIAELNAQFRGKQAPTNVLSWPAWDLSADAPGVLPEPPEPGSAEMPEGLGDIALSLDTCAREAKAQGKTLDDHATHLIVHSLLHLLGYDHENDPDAELMEETERKILAQMGVADPYAAERGAQPPGVAALD